jgi:RimJ/RimL family protein N-acetyltransferase
MLRWPRWRSQTTGSSQGRRVVLLEADDRDFVALLNGRPRRLLTLAPGGLETPEVLQMLRRVACRIREKFAPVGWLIVDGNEIVGLCTLKNAPAEDGVVEIGYGIAASRRRQGLARQAIAQVLAWARTNPRIAAVTAETAVENLASQRVLEHNGFLRVGERRDADDGELICWRASAPGPAIASVGEAS